MWRVRKSGVIAWLLKEAGNAEYLGVNAGSFIPPSLFQNEAIKCYLSACAYRLSAVKLELECRPAGALTGQRARLDKDSPVLAAGLAQLSGEILGEAEMHFVNLKR
jgi:hypothetical protein